MAKSILENLLTPDMIKVIYRGLLTIKQAALYIGKGEDYLQKKIDSGEIEVVLIEGEVRVAKFALDAFLKSNSFRKKAV